MSAPEPHRSSADAEPARHWEDRYGTEHVWSGTVNATTAAAVEQITAAGVRPGRALDLGCGEGADAIWLARHGWDTTGVDISTTATERARLAALEAGLAEDRIRFVARDLSAWATGDADTDPVDELVGPVDLVTASFFHSTVALARTEILRRAASLIAPGGHLVIVSHAAPPPWAQEAGHGTHHHDLLDPDGEIDALDLDRDGFDAVAAESRTRRAIGPDGREADLEDGLVILRRTA